MCILCLQNNVINNSFYTYSTITPSFLSWYHGAELIEFLGLLWYWHKIIIYELLLLLVHFHFLERYDSY